MLLILWSALLLLCIKKVEAFAVDIKLSTDGFGKLTAVSDCSNTILMKKFDTSNSIKLSSSSPKANVAFVPWLDNTTSRKKKKKQETKKKIFFEPCKKETGHSLISDKFIQNLQQQCTKDTTKKFRWHVLIYRTDESMFICQGALIDKNWVVTVAHCLVQYDESYLKEDVLRIRIKDSSTHVKVKKVIIPKDFQYSIFKNDIALLKIEDISTATNSKPICLPYDSSIVNQPLRSAWWEGDSYDDGLAGDFFDGQAQKLARARCQQRLAQSSISYSFDKNNICSGNPEYCEGDMWLRMTEGSPLFHKEASSSILIGLKSWGTGSFSCERNSQTEIFVEISKYLKWIIKEMKA